MISFLKFLSELDNPEKTRNFNIFKNYTLDGFREIIDQLQLIDNLNSEYNPLRISVVGTNGKGSTSHYLAEIIKYQFPGKTVGLYTSPHLLSPLERIVINGHSILEEEANHCISELLSKNRKGIKDFSYFECLTVVSLFFFRMRHCDFEIWEAGLGGRLDATKVINPNIIILTKIAFDHCEILGNTLSEIATEKMGIAGSNSKIIYSFNQSDEVANHIREQCAESGMIVKFYLQNKESNYLESNFSFAKWVLSDSKHLKSPHHPKLLELPAPRGRLEFLRNHPPILFDPAHNPSAISHTLESINQSYHWENASLLIGCLPDKDAKAILLKIKEREWVAVWFWQGEGFYSWQGEVIENFGTRLDDSEALATVLANLSSPLVVVGSFRLYSIVKNALQN